MLFTGPLYVYDHDDTLGRGESVIGLAFYRKPLGATRGFPPEYEGDYFFTDFFTGWIRRLHRTGDVWSLATPVPGQPNASTWAYGYGVITHGAVGPDGALYYNQLDSNYEWDHPSGVIRRIRYVGTVSTPRGAPPRVTFERPYPVPATRTVTLAFALPTPAPVRLEIHDAMGRLVRTLVAGTVEGAGRHERRWDGRDNESRAVAAGVYFARLRVADSAWIHRIPLVR
jgi:hypothetical protein